MNAPSPSSRKRSKWDDIDNDDNVQDVQPPPKRRSKSAASFRPVTSRASPLAVSNPPISRTSIYVPPRTAHPPLLPSRSVYAYERLNQIEEGSYGVVFRARDKKTGDIVALKKLKLDEEKHGFPITSLREVNALMACRHENVVGIREVVVGETLTQFVSSRAWLLQLHLNVYMQSIHRHGFH